VDRGKSHRPERNQAFGTRSRQSLAGMVHGQTVLIEWNKRDRYGRTVGKVFMVALCLQAPCPLARNANLAQIQAGLAWWYRQYAREQTPDDRRFYERAENEARAAKRGLWADAAPVPPWEWRHRKQRHQPPIDATIL
jgi:endonuclease YncB( thermonuclease family)